MLVLETRFDRIILGRLPTFSEPGPPAGKLPLFLRNFVSAITSALARFRQHLGIQRFVVGECLALARLAAVQLLLIIDLLGLLDRLQCLFEFFQVLHRLFNLFKLLLTELERLHGCLQRFLL